MRHCALAGEDAYVPAEHDTHAPDDELLVPGPHAVHPVEPDKAAKPALHARQRSLPASGAYVLTGQLWQPNVLPAVAKDPGGQSEHAVRGVEVVV